MDPKQLAAEYARKAGADRNKTHEVEAANAEFLEQITKSLEDTKHAIEKVVIPYFNEVKSQFPEGHFLFSVPTDAKDHRPVGVYFKVGKGPSVAIQNNGGNITITKTEVTGAPGKATFLYSSNAEPYISKPADLTTEKLGKLIKMLIVDA